MLGVCRHTAVIGSLSIDDIHYNLFVLYEHCNLLVVTEKRQEQRKSNRVPGRAVWRVVLDADPTRLPILAGMLAHSGGACNCTKRLSGDRFRLVQT